MIKCGAKYLVITYLAILGKNKNYNKIMVQNKT